MSEIPIQQCSRCLEDNEYLKNELKECNEYINGMAKEFNQKIKLIYNLQSRVKYLENEIDKISKINISNPEIRQILENNFQ